ncbi:TauD/TfdA dioxygenase family protein [Dongia rigui]|uniref:TauD/TfdA family dioxygenase n=1 Tax=Dongia rigui TaxID=940149 RepID=A0ABU5E1U1_9PROT|nr:TauD/TfdA family dioxygenase [Dongia rigui]MDY0873563.1 TauD/TfdA family dioxygenase [Dongia rigui]
MRNDLHIRPVTPHLGAEVSGVNLKDAPDAMLGEVQAAFAAHGVLFFPEQNLTPDELLAVTSRFGTVLRVPYVKGMDSHPDIIAVLKEADEKRISTFGGTWHTDFSFLPQPPDATLLQAAELPPVGGDTIWANQYLAYETLSPGLQRMLDPLLAVHTGWPHGTMGPGPDAAVSRSIKMVRNDASADREVLHPVVRVHPVTGRKALFVNPVYTQRFADMTAAESKPLLDFLHAHATRPEFQVRLKWQDGMLVMWDNRSTLHLAINDYDGQRRLLYRTTLAGAAPTGAASGR